MKQSVANLHITQHNNQQDDAGTITGNNMTTLSKHQRSCQNIENKFSLVPPRELYGQVVIATNAIQPEPGNWHTARQLSSNTSFIHHRQSDQTHKIRVVIANLANHPKCQAPYIMQSPSNKNPNHIFSVSTRHLLQTTKKQQQTTQIYLHMDKLPQLFPYFPMPHTFTYIPIYGQKTGELHHKQN